MKLAVLSDIHGNLSALRAVLEEIEREGVDAIVNLGDILSGPLQPAETADFLMARDYVTIAGNHERQLLKAHARGAPDPANSDGYAALQVRNEHLDWVRTLPAHRWLADDVLLVHGTPATDLTYWLETPVGGAAPGIRAADAQEVQARLNDGPLAAGRATLALCGHSHVPRAVQSGTTLIVNPGSVGLQAYEDAHVHPHVVEVGSPHARYAIVERHRSGWAARLCSAVYDWAAESRCAREHGRPDWAYALATGRMPPPAPTMPA